MKNQTAMKNTLFLKPLHLKMLGLVTFSLVLSACSWIDPLPGSGSVNLAAAQQVEHCKKIGFISTSVLDKIGFIPRDEEAVTKNLIELAKNEAVRMGGNTLVPLGKADKGQMQFDLFQCP